MASKRICIARSPSQREVALHPQTDPPETEQPTKKLSQNPTSDQAQPPRKSILLSSGLPNFEPTQMTSPGFGEFLQACSLCKRKLPESGTAYMYGYFGAYCSPECRENQVKWDRFHE